MEYFLARAMEIARLLPDQISVLQRHERKESEARLRCLMPWEIQRLFNLPALKERWRIPPIDNVQAAHAQRLRTDLKRLGIAPTEFLSIAPDDIHPFDWKIHQAVGAGKIDFSCAASAPKHRRSEEFDD